MVRSIISEKATAEKHFCDAEVLRVERIENPCAFKARIYCNAVFAIPLEDKKYINDIEKLLQNIIYNLDDRIKDIYKRC